MLAVVLVALVAALAGSAVEAAVASTAEAAAMVVVAADAANSGIVMGGRIPPIPGKGSLALAGGPFLLSLTRSLAGFFALFLRKAR